jgi:hypothetical protein
LYIASKYFFSVFFSDLNSVISAALAQTSKALKRAAACKKAILIFS